MASPWAVINRAGLLLLLGSWQCLASRPSSALESHGTFQSVVSPHGGSSLLEGTLSDAGTDNFAGSRETEDPPKPHELTEHIKAGGPLEATMKKAVTEAKELKESAEHWSATSRKIEGMSKKVVSDANTADKSLKEENDKVTKDAEANVKGILEDAQKGTGGRENVGREGDEGEHNTPDTALISLSSSEDTDAEAGTTDRVSESGIPGLLSSMNSTYGKLGNLLDKVESKANEVKETANRWASHPENELQRRAGEAERVLEKATHAMETSNEHFARDMTANPALGILSQEVTSQG